MKLISATDPDFESYIDDLMKGKLKSNHCMYEQIHKQ